MINHLEGKLERLETHLNSIFNVGDTSPVPDTPPGDNGSSASASNNPRQDTSNNQNMEGMSSQTAPVLDRSDLNTLINTMQTRVVSGLHQETRPCFYIPRCMSGTGSGCFSVLTDEGLDWISQKVDSSQIDPLLGNLTSDPQLSSLLPPRKVFCSFPRAEPLSQLLHNYMEYFNITFPVYTLSEIECLFAENYADPRLCSPGQSASIHVILAVAYMLPSENSRPDHQRSAMFMKSALQTISEIVLAPPELWACKAILVMAVLFLAASAAHPCSSLISVAVQISNQLGLQRSEARPGLSMDDVHHQHLLFWLICAIDTEISYRFGVPPAQQQDVLGEAMSINSPSSAYSVPIRDESGTFNLFHSAIELIQIRTQVIRQLYLASVANKPFDQLLAVAGNFDSKLQTWLRKIPHEYQPDSEAIPPFRQSPALSTLLFTHYNYHDCMIAIHSLVAMRGVESAHDLTGGNRLSIAPEYSKNPRVLLSTSLASKAARASLTLLKYLPRDDIHLGIAYYYPSVAMKTLASSIIRSPRHTSEIYNLKMLYQAESYLSQTATDCTLEAIRRLAKVCTDCCAVAQRAMDSA
ncbi:fungal specific transcription factor domain-containing protein [Aspergillus homomorphus CBS 101889]|uniref:Xylanolytic transcriptional activator regulatory domain-containing protein n=1 Tax=Aspergillus homomorphus (strain CBS 101889) TaxID=1450537 RepID=A0A395HHZ8_ASPHC|nr:hypothetical protein BO97DRAFT_438487 [Aspergillus homomorphus CBS 101889]RAL07370.1 hypothetical protein BO97DRAFT_438487 [Aspergillus homomorphus CBS 101889]